MKYLELFFDRGNYAKITGEDYRSYHRGGNDNKAVLDSVTIIERDVVDPTIFNTISTTTSSLVTKDKVFIMPGVTIPRYKIRETGKEIGFDIVRSLSKATKVIYCHKQVTDEMIKKQSCIGIEIKHVKLLFDQYNMDTTELENTTMKILSLTMKCIMRLRHYIIIYLLQMI